MINLNYFRPKNQKKFNLAKSREKFKKRKSKNLKFLLEKRYLWMKKYLDNKKKIIELGSGNGLSKIVLNNKSMLLTDIDIHDWIDHKIDMKLLANQYCANRSRIALTLRVLWFSCLREQ